MLWPHRLSLSCSQPSIRAIPSLDTQEHPTGVFTRQELIYLALGARTLAKQSQAEADKAAWYAIQSIHEDAAKYYAELAKKCEELAKTAAVSSSVSQAASPSLPTP